MPHDLSRTPALAGAAVDTGMGRFVVTRPTRHEAVHGAVGRVVTATGEPVPFGAHGTGRQRADSYEMGNGSVIAQPFGILPGSGQQLTSDAGPAHPRICICICQHPPGYRRAMTISGVLGLRTRPAHKTVRRPPVT